ncbi:MAG: hypothetical protein KDB07_06260, partial [Planctomycetes bacterium]|nr:hypothetical protein [Planctomycetota bacterium]
ITEFSDEAQGFVRSYYGNEGLYWDDFVSVARRPYQVSEREINYSTLEALINERRKRGVFTKAGAVKLPPSKPWWKFWAGS